MVSDPAMRRAMPPNSRRIHLHTSATPSGALSDSIATFIIFRSPPALNPPIGSGHDDGADVGVGIECLQRPAELPGQWGGQHIEPVGFVERDDRPVAAVIDVHPFGRIGVIAGRNHRAVHGIHCSFSSISLACNTADVAVATFSTTSLGSLAASDASRSAGQHVIVTR
jgi:hypothetical protein